MPDPAKIVLPTIGTVTSGAIGLRSTSGKVAFFDDAGEACECCEVCSFYQDIDLPGSYSNDFSTDLSGFDFTDSVTVAGGVGVTQTTGGGDVSKYFRPVGGIQQFDASVEGRIIYNNHLTAGVAIGNTIASAGANYFRGRIIIAGPPYFEVARLYETFTGWGSDPIDGPFPADGDLLRIDMTAGTTPGNYNLDFRLNGASVHSEFNYPIDFRVPVGGPNAGSVCRVSLSHFASGDSLALDGTPGIPAHLDDYFGELSM